MGVMILPLVVVLVAGLLVLGMVCAERFPVRSWPSRIRSVVRNSQEVRLAEQDVEVEVDAPFSPEEPPGSWQDARVAATPMALMAAMIRFEAVIMMEPPLLSIRPR